MSAFASSLSGLSAATWMVTVAAGNVANVNTAGFRARKVGFEADAEGGVRAQPLTEEGPDPGAEGSNVDLASEMVSLRVGYTTFAANGAALRTQQEILGMALDLKA